MSMQFANFVADFLHAFLTNLRVGFMSLIVGLMVGAPLALLRRGPVGLSWPANFMTALLRAAPTFVVMFFLLNMLPPNINIADVSWRVSPELVLTLSLAVYAAGYVSDNLLDALRHLAEGATGAALLFFPGMIRALFVLVMASSTGAAIGVHEAVTTTLREADTLPGRTNRIALVLVVILFFALVLQIANKLAHFITARLTHHFAAAHQPKCPQA